MVVAFVLDINGGKTELFIIKAVVVCTLDGKGDDIRDAVVLLVVLGGFDEK